jgi:guanylate kinase
MNGKIALVGAATSGKDYLRKRFMKRGFVYGVSCTTRLPRPGEVHGEDYYYLTTEEFDSKIERGEFVEWQDFNGWKYGLTKDEFERCDVMILNAEAVNLLVDEYRERLFVIYLDIPEETRRARLNQRNDKDDTIERRIQADNEQFGNFINYDCIINNENF